MYNVSAAEFLGGGLYWFDLQSECVNRKYAYVRVFASGVGTGYGLPSIKLGATGGGVEFHDGNLQIDPGVFTGSFVIAGGGVGIGIGIAASVQHIQLGKAISKATWPPSSNIGIDASIQAFGGRSSVTTQHIRDCLCP